MDSAWPAPAWWDSASVLDLAWGEGHPWIYESNQVGVIVLNIEIIQKTCHLIANIDKVVS